MWLVVIAYSQSRLQSNYSTHELPTYKSSQNTSKYIFSTTSRLEIPGEYGKPYHLTEKDLNPVEKVKYLEGWKKYEFNQYLSDMISVNRPLNDIRDPM